MKFNWTPKDGQDFMKRILIIVGIGVGALLLYLWHDAIAAFFAKCVRVLKPLLYAVVVAYILWPMTRFFEQKVFDRLGHSKPNKRLIRTLSLLLTYVIFLLILVLFFSTVIPQIVDSVKTLADKAQGYVVTVQNWFYELSPETPVIGPLMDTELFQELRGKLIEYTTRFIEWLTGNMTGIVSGITEYAKTFATETWNVVLGIIFSVYFILFKENLFAQASKLMHASLRDKQYDRVVHYVMLTDSTFGGFINGKLLDSLIIGLLCFLFMKIFRMPYAPLISMIVGITNVIPFFGPFIGAVPSAFFILIADPKMTLWFVLLIVLLQQLDGNVIGPKILGDFVGLNPLWIIVSITVMGGFFGVFGMFFGVPTFAVIYAVVKELTEKKLAAIGKPVGTEDYYDDPAYEEIVNPERKGTKLPELMGKAEEGIRAAVSFVGTHLPMKSPRNGKKKK
jgi:predicted PurR-regulated permease PerM